MAILDTTEEHLMDIRCGYDATPARRPISHTGEHMLGRASSHVFLSGSVYVLAYANAVGLSCIAASTPANAAILRASPFLIRFRQRAIGATVRPARPSNTTWSAG